MGIPGLFKHLLDNFRDDIIRNALQPCDYLLFDYNCLIHLCKPLASDKVEMFKAIVHYTKEIISMVSPKIETYIAIDGFPPEAKLVQQRRRRYLSAYEREFNKREFNKPELDKTNRTFNSNEITPGTTFMTELSLYLREHLPKDRVVFSGWEEDGEGEHKMFLHMARRNVPKDANVYIYGLDADMIMLSLMHNDDYNIFLLREKDHDAPIDKALLRNFQSVDIRALHTIISKALVSGNVIDFIPLAMLVGNDFLPPLSHLHVKRDMEYLIRQYNAVYASLSQCFVVNKKVNVSFLKALLAKLSSDEDAMFANAHDAYYATKPKRHLSAWENLPTTMRVNHAINPRDAGWRPAYHMTLFHDVSVKEVVENYLEGIEWNLQYYIHHTSMWDWSYKFAYSPTMMDCFNHLQSCKSLHNGKHTKTEIIQTLEQVDSRHKHISQLLYVIPFTDMYILPEKYQRIYTDVLYGCVHMFPTSFCIHTYMKSKTHECIPIIPMANIDRLVRAIEKANADVN